MKHYWTTILIVIVALIQIPGVLNGSKFSLFVMCVSFLMAVVTAILNAKTHEIQKQLDRGF